MDFVYHSTLGLRVIKKKKVPIQIKEKDSIPVQKCCMQPSARFSCSLTRRRSRASLLRISDGYVTTFALHKAQKLSSGKLTFDERVKIHRAADISKLEPHFCNTWNLRGALDPLSSCSFLDRHGSPRRCSGLAFPRTGHRAGGSRFECRRPPVYRDGPAV